MKKLPSLLACAACLGFVACEDSSEPGGSSKHNKGSFKAMTVGDITISGAYIVEPTSRFAFPNIVFENAGSEPDQIISITGGKIDKVFIKKRAKNDQGITQSSSVDSISIDAGETLDLKKKTYSIQLICKGPFPKAGEKVSVKMAFEKAGEVTIEIPVVGSKVK